MGSRLKIAITICVVAAFGLGVLGTYPLLDKSSSVGDRVTEAIYLSLNLFTNGYPDFIVYSGEAGADDLGKINLPFQIARFLAPALTITALIGLLSVAFEGAIKRIKIRLFYRDHAVVFGFNIRSRMICEDLIRKRIRLIVVDSDLSAGDIEWLGRNKIPFFHINGNAVGLTKTCATDLARYVFATHESESLNMKILVLCFEHNRAVFESFSGDYKKRAAARHPTFFYAHFFSSEYKNLRMSGRFSVLEPFFNLRIFSIYDLTAQRFVLSIYKELARPCLEGSAIHFHVFGLSLLGHSMVDQLVRICPFLNDSATEIFVHEDDASEWDMLISEYPVFDVDPSGGPDAERLAELKRDIAFPRITHRRHHPRSSAIRTGKSFDANGDRPVVRIAIVGGIDATYNLAIADILLSQSRNPFAGVYIRSDDPQSEVRAHVKEEMERKQLRALPSLEEICSIDFLDGNHTDQLARAIHENYIKSLPADAPKTPSTVPWSQLDEWFKDSNRRAAAHMELKCKLLGADLDADDRSGGYTRVAERIEASLAAGEKSGLVDKLTRSEHNRWSCEKLVDGWTPGTRRDDTRRLHPNLVPWDFDPASGPFAGYVPLTESDKRKDRNNVTEIPRLIRLLDT